MEYNKTEVSDTKSYNTTNRRITDSDDKNEILNIFNEELIAKTENL